MSREPQGHGNNGGTRGRNPPGAGDGLAQGAEDKDGDRVRRTMASN